VRASRLFLLAGLAALAVLAPSAVAGSNGDYSGTDASFGSQAVNSSSSPMTVTITNTSSTTDHTVSSLSLGGTDPGQFSLGNSTCPGLLTAGSPCTVDVTFTPTSAGSKSATVDVNDETGTIPGVAALTGAGVGTPTDGVTPSSWDFGSVLSGNNSTKTFTLSNNGTGDLNVGSLAVNSGGASFGLQNDSCSGSTVSAGNSCHFDVQFSASGSQGLRTGNVHIPDNLSGNDVALQGTVAVASVNVSPGSIPFSAQVVGGGGTSQNVTVTDNGTAPVTVSTSLITGATTGAGFSQDGGCNGSVLQPGDHCTISVGFDPTTGGAKSGTLEIDDSTPNGPETVGLTGTGDAPNVTVGSLNFGNVLLGQTKHLPLTLQNNGTALLHVTSVALNTGGTTNYTLSADTCTGHTVGIGASCTVDVAFHPVVSGGHAGDILVADDAPTSPQNPTLTGTGLSQFVQITPATFNFPTQTVGKLGATQVFTLKNLDSVNLVIPGSVAINPASANPLSFRVISGNCGGQTIAPSGTCTFTVQFTPGAAGSLTAQARDTDSAPDSPHGVQLTGTGVHPPNITNLHGSAGCTKTTTLWTPSTASGLVGTWIERNATRVPRTPFDGTHLIHTRSGVLLDSGLSQFHTYYYAIWSTYRFSPSGQLIYSAKSYVALHTQRVCSPQNHAAIYTTTPLIDWTGVSGAFAYGMRIYNHGSQIFAWAKRTTTSQLQIQIQSSWTYRGVSHSLKKGENYQIFLYAYTDRNPDGFPIGTSYFSVH
jgi:Abnormal spindle-like microcephaly-assoc'd, ASPM-SPD-2-Hydin